MSIVTSAINGIPPNKPTQPSAVSSQVTGKLAKGTEEAQTWQTYEATAYTAFCSEGCIGITATGLDVSETTTYKGFGIAATDPKIIPMYTVFEIEGVGTYIALDKGGNIKGNRIDILMNSQKSALKFGRQKVKVKVIRGGVVD